MLPIQHSTHQSLLLLARMQASSKHLKAKPSILQSTKTRKRILAEMKLMVFIKISFDTLMEVILSGVPRELNIMTRELSHPPSRVPSLLQLYMGME